MNERKETSGLPTSQKRAWKSPKLIQFGDVKAITKQTKVPSTTEVEDVDNNIFLELLS